MSRLTEVEVASAITGEPAALGRVYEALSPAIAAYLRSRGSEDPEGLTQDVFVALLPRLGRLRGGAAGLYTLAFSLAHARLVDEIRRRAKRPRVQSFEPSTDPRSAASAEEHALSRVGNADLCELLGRLKKDQREVVTLRVVGQLSLEETAEVVGKSVGAVKQLQRRGLLSMRAAVQAREGVS